MAVMTAGEVKAWLISQGLIIEENIDFGLQQLLRDGLILCQLVNRLKPRIVPSLNYNTESAAACIANVTSFIDALRKLEIHPLFKVNDLVEERNTTAVLATMTSLAKKAAGMGMGPKDFDVDAVPDSHVTVRQPQPVSITSSRALSMGIKADQEEVFTDSTAANAGSGKYAKALYSFTGSAADELQFEAGDIIEVTQVMEGGWWEGSKQGTLGWFPCAYVKSLDKDEESLWTCSLTSSVVVPQQTEAPSYHDVVVNDVIQSEQAHVNDMQNFVDKYLQALRSADILTQSELRVLSGNMEELITFHSQFLGDLHAATRQPVADRQIGKCFCTALPQMRLLSGAYCSNHPCAVQLLTDNGEKLGSFMESHGASSPGILALTTNLSKPFVRLEKYPALLRELDRYTPEDHSDRPNIEQALPLYRDLVDYARNTRKHREMELDMLSGNIDGWTGTAITKLGECNLMSTVKVPTEDGESEDERYLLLFPGYLVVLAINPSLNGYSLIFKLPLSEAAIKDSEAADHGVSIIAGANKLVGSCSSDEERELLVSIWEKCSRLSTATIGSAVKLPKTPPSVRQTQSGTEQWAKQPTFRHYTVGTGTDIAARMAQKKPLMHTQSSNAAMARSNTLPYFSARSACPLESEPIVTRARRWSFRSMRPPPPIRPSLAVHGEPRNSPVLKRKIMPASKRTRRKSEDDLLTVNKDMKVKALEDDSILKVIEAYCNSNRAKRLIALDENMMNVPLTVVDGDVGTTV